ncbi:hypothetical protein LTR08_008557 [Meristemomyces frigidus]|nr:hypothetical protein LTR08_008557 [Meristemomyces frigidus]
MSAKFFTWTKGDRRNASESLSSGGVVPIPAECITIHGMDYARSNKGSSKATKKPLPLLFDPISDWTPEHGSRACDSAALQSAALQSATSLMAVMSDMLRSPHVSARLSAQHNSAGVLPMHGRPRSHTAPPTPLVEAPSTLPVELPGSLLSGKKSVLSLDRTLEGRASHTPAHSMSNGELGADLGRTHSSPQLYEYQDTMSQSTDSCVRNTSLIGPIELFPRSTGNSPRSYSSQHSIALPNQANQKTPVMHSRELLMSSLDRRPPNVPQRRMSKSPAIDTISQAGSTWAVPQFESTTDEESTLQLCHTQNLDSEGALLEQISLMRATHEAHLSSLREAHEKEKQSHRTYIHFLENRSRLPQVQFQPSRRHLTLDTTHAPSKSGEISSANTLQSWDSSFGAQKRASQEAVAETEALRRKLSLCRKAVAESGDIRRERDHLRNSVDSNDRRIVQLKDIVRKSKDSERCLKNAVLDLEARLTLANNQRIDVLEGFHEASERTRELTERERMLRKSLKNAHTQIEGLRSMGFQRPPTPTGSTSSITSNCSSMKMSGAPSTDDSYGGYFDAAPGLGILLAQTPQTPSTATSSIAHTESAPVSDAIE